MINVYRKNKIKLHVTNWIERNCILIIIIESFVVIGYNTSVHQKYFNIFLCKKLDDIELIIKI